MFIQSHPDNHNSFIESAEQSGVHEECVNETSAQPFLQPPRKRRSFLVEWKRELLTYLLGTAGVISMLVLLLVFDEKPLSAWKSSVQITATIAGLSQLAQSALIVSVSSSLGQLKWSWFASSERSIYDLHRYDSASRGPEGGLMLLVDSFRRLPKRNMAKGVNLLSQLGAWITLIMLVFGPVAQQTVTTSQIRVFIEPNSTAVAPRALSYDPPVLNGGPGSTGRNQVANGPSGPDGLDLQIYTSMNLGMTLLSTLSDLSAACPLYSCSWESYTTLALCSTVEDISASLKVTDWNETNPRFVNLTIPELEKFQNQSDIQTGYVMNSLFWVYSTHAPELPDIPTASRYEGSTHLTQLKVSEAYLVYIPPCDATIKEPDKFPLFTPRSNSSLWRAYKATFSVCLQTLWTNVENGKTITRAFDGPQTTEWQFKEIELDAKTRDVSYYTDFGDETKERYSINYRTLDQINNILGSFLRGNSSGYDFGDIVHSSIWEAGLTSDILGTSPGTCDFKSDPTKEFSGWQKRVQSLSDSVTNAFRASPQKVEVQGFVDRPEQFIEVDLRWFTLPAVVWLAVTVLLFSTIWKSSGDDTPLWKSSPLALLDCTEKDNQLGTVRQFKKQMRGTRMQLRSRKTPYGSTWNLEQVH